MKKRNILAFGGLALCLSLTACTPDGEIDFEKAHEVIDVMESELNKIDKEEVKQNVADGLSQVADALKDTSELVEDLGATPTTQPTVTPVEEEETDKE